MKKNVMIACLAILTSCGNDTPKCDDPEIQETVIQLIVENRTSLEYLVSLIARDEKNLNIDNIMTTSENSELNSCGCEATLNLLRDEGRKPIKTNISYTAQKNSQGEVIVKIENLDPIDPTQLAF